MPDACRHEQVTGNLIDRVQDREVADSLLLQRFHEPASRAPVFLQIY
jgi:hypothetical protein